MSAQPALLYERVARLVETQIATGTLRTNDRIPSVRSMSRTAKVSVSTVVQAYVHLESIGLIEARPQSGFYVRPPDPQTVPEPRAKPTRSRRPMTIAAEMLDTCREALSRNDIIPLNGAFTSPALYPTQRLNNLTREVLRDRPLHAGELIMPPGDPELRRQVAKRMALAGAPTDPEHVVITSGTMDAITWRCASSVSRATPCWWNRPRTSVCCRQSNICDSRSSRYRIVPAWGSMQKRCATWPARRDSRPPC